MNRCFIVADDFTGSNDTGVQLTRRGFRTKVVLDPAGVAEDGLSYVLDTESRNIPNAEAREKVARLLEGLRLDGFDCVVKKVDSTLRGNIAEEIQETDRALGSELVIFMPALPSLGRTTWLNNPANRYQEIKDKDGKGTGKYDETTTNHIGTGSVDMTDESKNKILYDENCPIGFNPFAQEFVGYNTCHREKGDIQPTVYSTKHWRNGRGTHWQGDQWLPDHIYMKRLANVMLDYAECCFRTGEAAKGWEQINKLRQRAWGMLEDGKEAQLAAKFNSYFVKLKKFYDKADNGFGQYTLPENTEGWYPIPFGSKGNTPEDAETYYTKLKADKGFTSEVWKVAVNEERRKEFNAEWSLKTDMQKSGYLVDHIEHNYPKGYGHETGIEQIYEWRTYRGFDFDERKMDMPIPQDEIIKNPACTQNEAYIKSE